ncbi:hypothetical protein C8J55DRAFT_565421 [Lentinula edodes]|uniref:Uncharacterized protein n=1 Tax=Lentinula lateritia TaxID=40482 RepID=A0A9W8ZUZ1_9AGAR|nr:hypothetical protein C8J55DRAFT_565421 [Lentinula edodes]
MQLLSPSTKLSFTLWMGALFVVPTMAVPTGTPPPKSEPLMSGGLSASNSHLPGQSTGAHGNTYDQVLDASDVNTGLNPIIEARLWIHPKIFDDDPNYRTAMGFAVEHMMEPIQSTILKDIHEDNPSLTFPGSSTSVAVYRLSGKDFTNQGDFEISFSGMKNGKNWWFAMPGSGDPSYFGHVDLKCLVKTPKGSYTVKKKLVTGKISRRLPGENEEVLVSFKNGEPKKSALSRVKTLFGKKPDGPSSS